MEYIRDEATLPIPFNIVPTPKSLIRIGQCIKRLFCPHRKDADVQPHPGRITDRELFHSANSPVSLQ
jgi:hypothetical protein